MSIQERSSVEAMKQALEALESKYIVNCGAWRVQQDKAITALRQAIHATELREQAEVRSTEEQAQPVAMYEDWYDSNSCGHCGMVGGHATSCRHYTAPPPRKPLTDAETEKIIRIYDGGNSEVRNAMRGLKRAIESAHGIYAPTGLKGEA